MSDCPYIGKTLLEKREFPLLPPTLGKIWELSKRGNKVFLDKQDFLVAYQLIEMSPRGQVLPDKVVRSLLTTINIKTNDKFFYF